MKVKRGLISLMLVLLGIVILSSFIIGVENTTQNDSANTGDSTNSGSFEKTYSCLSDLVDSKMDSGMTNEEMAFSLLALGYDSTKQAELRQKLKDNSKDNECWPKSGCTLKDTSLVLLAYNHIGENTGAIESWLLNQSVSPSELTWYLQIDSDSKEVAQCTVTYDNNARKITLNQDKTITGTAGNCFASSTDNRWLEITTACYGKTFEVSCDKDFLTSLIYKRKSSSVIYVSTLTNTAAPGGKTTEKVESACLKQGSAACNYEGNLWAALALQKTGNDIKKFIPYLLTLSSENQKYMPSSFLYVLTIGFNEYFNDLINNQNKLGYWQYSDAAKRYYDTSIAVLSLGAGSDPSLKAKDYLLDSKVQGDGCYNNNIRDAAFIAYAFDPRAARLIVPKTKCSENTGYACITQAQCEEVNGTTFSDYTGCLGVNVCCSKKYVEKSCSEKGGKTCSENQICEDGTWASGNNKCCLGGECVDEGPETGEECVAAEGTCKSSCLDTENANSAYPCAENRYCCIAKPIEKKSYWWLWLLIILVTLLVLAIIFRNQLKIYWLKIKGKITKKPVASQTRPNFPSSMPPSQTGIRRIIPQVMQRPIQKPFPKDRELEETLKKLRDIHK